MFGEEGEKFNLNLETGHAGQPLEVRLYDIKKIFDDFKDELLMKKGLGRTNFEDILKQTKGLRNEFEKLLKSEEVNELKKLDYENELDEMDEILRQAKEVDEVEK